MTGQKILRPVQISESGAVRRCTRHRIVVSVFIVFLLAIGCASPDSAEVQERVASIHLEPRDTSGPDPFMPSAAAGIDQPFIGSRVDLDTRVTNFGYTTERLTSRQSVLEAGTAVLVDDRGVPRVRCACGNPLGQPLSGHQASEYEGQPWPQFTPEHAIEITPADTSILLAEQASPTSEPDPHNTNAAPPGPAVPPPATAQPAQTIQPAETMEPAPIHTEQEDLTSPWLLESAPGNTFEGVLTGGSGHYRFFGATLPGLVYMIWDCELTGNIGETDTMVCRQTSESDVHSVTDGYTYVGPITQVTRHDAVAFRFDGTLVGTTNPHSGHSAMTLRRK